MTNFVLMNEAKLDQEQPVTGSNDVIINSSSDNSNNGNNQTSWEFDDVFQGHNLPAEMRAYYAITYQYIMMGFYIFFTLVIGTVLLVVYSAIIAVVRFLVTWFLSPPLQMTVALLKTFEALIQALINTTMRPVFISVGYIYAKITIRHQSTPAGQQMIV